MCELVLEKEENKITIEEYKDKSIQFFFPIIFIFLWWIGELIYFIYAFNHDTLKYPTMIILGYFIPSKLFDVNKKDLSTDEGRAEYRYRMHKGKPFFRIFNSLCYCVYFSYMFWLIVF